MRKGKRRLFDQMHTEIVAERERSGVAPPTWAVSDLNNAHLLTSRLYHGRVAEFQALFAECREDFACFYERAKQLAD